MSKRYVIQVRQFNYDVNSSELAPTWENVQHPSGGDWMTRSRSTAIADAAKLVHDGETRELRIGVSRPVYAVTPEVDFEAIKAAEQEMNWTDAGSYLDDDDDNDDDDTTFELVDDGPAVTNGDDPTGN